MDSLRVTEVRPFLPARDFAQSRDFYVALGWTLTWEDEQLALLTLGDHAFYLHNCPDQDFANEHMLFVQVESTQAWYEHVAAVLETKKFGTARVFEPKNQQNEYTVVHLVDPSGVLLHFTEPARS